MKSLRAQLLWSAGTATVLVWGIAVVASYFGTRHEAIEFLDGQLAQSARLLLSQAQHEMKEAPTGNHGNPPDPLVETIEDSRLRGYEQPLEFQVWALQDNARPALILRSPHVPTLGMNTKLGYAEITHEGLQWRTYTRRDASNRFQVQVAQPTGKRTKAALEVAGRVLAPFAIALPLLLALLFLSVGRSLRPLLRLADDVAQRAPDALTPLPVDDMPEETRALIASLNNLLERLRRALENERRFTADAAHELRTPLAALKIQAQVAQKAPDEVTRAHALEQLLAGVTRSTRLVEQLLRLARLDPLTHLAEAQAMPLAPLLRQVAESLAPEVQAKQISLDIQAPETLAVDADADLLHLAIRNLLENALRYAPAQGHVVLAVASENGHVILQVKDNGPGVPPDELERITERFYRGRNIREPGSGLGLAIVQRIAQLHHAALELENLQAGGFQATLRFPKP